jgi:hypothetical protein
MKLLYKLQRSPVNTIINLHWHGIKPFPLSEIGLLQFQNYHGDIKLNWRHKMDNPFLPLIHSNRTKSTKLNSSKTQIFTSIDHYWLIRPKTYTKNRCSREKIKSQKKRIPDNHKPQILQIRSKTLFLLRFLASWASLETGLSLDLYENLAG